MDAFSLAYLIFGCISVVVTVFQMVAAAGASVRESRAERAAAGGVPRQNLDYHYITFRLRGRKTTVQIPGNNWERIRAMCYGDDPAERLIIMAIEQYPGRNGQWYVDKVIWDLERDRH